MFVTIECALVVNPDFVIARRKTRVNALEVLRDIRGTRAAVLER
jgi:hypothetical protein